MTSIADSFRNDPEVAKAKVALLGALRRHQANITGASGPQDDLVQSYEDTLAAFAAERGGNLYFPYLGSGIGNGPLVELADGSVKYDFISGIGVHHFGHSHPKLVEASIDAALGDTIMQGNLQQNVESHVFARKLIDAANVSGAGFDHCFLTSSGVMAGENALKIAMQKKYPASRVLAFSRCFAGRTMTFSQITDKPNFRVGLPTMLQVDYVPFFNAEDPEGSIRRAVMVVKKHLTRYPNQHAAMIMELVQGEGGFYPAPAEFHKAIIEVLKENNVAVLFDEVQTFARTPQLFAFQHLGLDELADVVWIGKASQICATLFRKDFAPKPGLLSQTFTSSSTAIAAGTVILDELVNDDYFGDDGKVVRIHNHMAGHLAAISERHPNRMSGPFGIGAMVACTVFGGDAAKSSAFCKHLFANGVMGFVAGSNPTRMRFLLPIGAVETDHIDEAVKIIEQTLVSMDE